MVNIADSSSERDQARVPPFLLTYRDRYLYNLCMSCSSTTSYPSLCPQWSIVLTKPDLMFPAQTNTNATNAEPSADPADLLFRIPLWMDLSMHLLPAVALLLGTFFIHMYKTIIAQIQTFSYLKRSLVQELQLGVLQLLLALLVLYMPFGSNMLRLSMGNFLIRS
jgi:hypothetical protein